MAQLTFRHSLLKVQAKLTKVIASHAVTLRFAVAFFYLTLTVYTLVAKEVETEPISSVI